jgi:hypothetical protein
LSRDYIGYVSLICRFIATQNYKSSWDLHQQKQVGLDTWQPELVSLPGTDPWSRWSVLYDSEPLDLGSVNAPPPLDHRDSGVGWSRKDIMDRQKILIEHWRWLQVNGTKQQAASCKRQALDLTRKNYNVIGVYRRKKYDDKIYESKRSIKNN